MTKLLPPHAHLGHLKKQAKTLLRDARHLKTNALRRFAHVHPSYAEGVSDAQSLRLQEAQLVIAREYGVSSWAALTALLGSESSPELFVDSDVLMFTNGSSAIDLFEKVGVVGQKEEWVDVLHEGPVPVTLSQADLNKVRAKYLSDLGWAGFDSIMSRFQKRDQLLAQLDDYAELQLWFEHDLFDQLLLIQLIDRIAERPEWIAKTKLFQFGTYIGRLNTETFESACPVPQSFRQTQIEEAQKVWHAFRQDHPQALSELVHSSLSTLPYLKSAMIRFCEEFPSVKNGCGRTEQQILKAVQAGVHSPAKIFQYSQEQEEAIFMGDASFYHLIEGLTEGKHPLLLLENADRFLHPSLQGYTEAFRRQELTLTKAGEQALMGTFNRLTDLPQPYWRGGCEIKGPESPCWDEHLLRFK